MLVATAALVAGCDALPDPTTEPATSPATGPAASPTGPATTDDDLAARVLDDLAAATALAETIARRHPDLRGVAQPFATLHRSHGAMLGDLPPATVPRVRRKQARDDLRKQERRLQDRLVQAAGSAESGALAQAFAAMAAAVAQQREVTR